MTIETSSVIKEKSESILAEIKRAKSVLLHCHPSPDPDSVCSALAMKFVIEQLGGKATVIRGDSEIPQAFMHFPGAKEIVMKNFWEIDLGEFDLFVILDSGAPEMISRLRPIVFPLLIKTINIDHHASNLSYADINLVDVTSPATAFIIFQLFQEWKVKFTPEIARNVFMGMYTDTGGFKYPPIDYRVLQAASELAKIVPDFTQTIFVMENSMTKESIYFDALALSSIETYFNDTVAIASVSNDDLLRKNISIRAVSGNDISNTLKSVIGWNLGVLITEAEPNKVKVSFRTRDSQIYNVSKLAVALGGGGHKDASGTVLFMPFVEAKELVVKKIKELYNL